MKEPLVHSQASHVAAVAQNIQECGGPLFPTTNVGRVVDVAELERTARIYGQLFYKMCTGRRASVDAQEAAKRRKSSQVIIEAKLVGKCTER